MGRRPNGRGLRVRWRTFAIGAAVLGLAIVFIPISSEVACEGTKATGGPHCLTTFSGLTGIPFHPAVAIFVLLTQLALGLAWLMHRPTPRPVARLLEGRGAGFTLLRAVFYTIIVAGLVTVFFLAPLAILEKTGSTRGESIWWMWIGVVVAEWAALIAVGARYPGGGPSRAHRHPSAMLGPDRPGPPDSRRN